MGYFSSGTEGDMYIEQYCEECVHYEGCAVMSAHMACSYKECNKPESILHMLIPRDEAGYNEKCRMYYQKSIIAGVPFDG